MNGPSASPVLLALNGLTAGYRGVPVVRNLDLEVRAGEIVALLGPNGAGKTTTLKTISGLLPRISGTIEVLGETQAATRRMRSKAVVSLARRGLAHVPEERALFYGLSGRAHLRLAARRGDSAAVTDALAPFPALTAILDRPAGLMSGGEQQMLAIARALVARPKLLMIDELSLGLAPIIVEQLLTMVRDIARNTGVGVLLVAFPLAHGVILGALYLPVALMLIGLTLRGVAFDFRVKARSEHKPLWEDRKSVV